MISSGSQHHYYVCTKYDRLSPSGLSPACFCLFELLAAAQCTLGCTRVLEQCLIETGGCLGARVKDREGDNSLDALCQGVSG